MLETNSETGAITRSARSAVERIQQCKQAGEPIVLVINGKLELPVQDETSYEQLLDLIDRLETIAAIRQGMKEIEAGQGVSLEEFKDQVRQKHGIPL